MLSNAPTSQKKFPWTFLIAGLAIMSAVGYLIYANTQTTALYYMTVPELHACRTCIRQDVRVAGVVQAGSIVRDDQQNQVLFTVTAEKQSMTVMYQGIVPDIFQAGIQVVVEGTYIPNQRFQADTLLTKCPSHFSAAGTTT